MGTGCSTGHSTLFFTHFQFKKPPERLIVPLLPSQFPHKNFMSKRKTILVASALVVLLALFLAKFQFNLSFRGSMRPKEIPLTRPERSDQAQLKRFADKTMKEILAQMSGEVGKKGGRVTSTATALLDSLPDTPLPFSDDAKPGDAAALKGFVDSIQQGKEGEPTLLDRWRYNLAAAALHLNQSKLPESLKLETQPRPGTENFPIHLREVDREFVGPFATGNFDREDGLEIVSRGGSRMSKIAADGKVIKLTSLDGTFSGNGLFPADFDNDGKLDLFITRNEGLPNSLLQNLGNGKFKDVTIELGLLAFTDTTTAAWIDYDNDGHLDLLVGSREQPLELYRQTSGGTFQPVAWDLNLWIYRGVVGIEVSDIDSDGFPDFFLSVDGDDDKLYYTTPANDWKDWRFVDVAESSQIRGSKAGSVAKFFDFDNDGDQDLLLGDPALSGEALQVEHLVNPNKKTPRALRLYQNRGDGIFDQITGEVSLAGVQDVQSIGIADLDADGYEDIVIGSGQLAVNRAFWNRQGMDFRDITVSSGMSYLDGVGAITVADIDGDGSIELLLENQREQVRWMKSEGRSGAWLQVDLQGGRPGMRVALVLRDKDWILHSVQRTVAAAPQISFGLGDAKTIESIQIFAPEIPEPIKTLEKQQPNQSLLIHIPKIPKKRAVVPIAAGDTEG